MRVVLFLLFLLFQNLQAQSPLCASRPTSFCCEYVSSVTINGKTYAGSSNFTSNPGGNPAGYFDYAYTNNAVPSIKAGQSISISYTGVTNGNYMQYFKLWIDFNGNGILTDAGELIHAQNQAWVGTRTMSYTFTVPTTVFNGQVYMRFVMQFSGSPTICGTYPYGNTFDFVTTITGATDPFTYSGYVLDSEESPITNFPIKLFSKLKSASTYTFESTVNTDSKGHYKLASKNAASLYDFQLEIAGLTFSNPTTTDATVFNQKLFASTNAKDYYRMDVNNNNTFTVTDVYLVYQKINGVAWRTGVPDYRIFLPAEFAQIKASTSNLKTTYPGLQSYTKSNLTNKDSLNFYIIRTGYHK
jgi:hypothetical protein